jgi:hypothetical protein
MKEGTMALRRPILRVPAAKVPALETFELGELKQDNVKDANPRDSAYDVGTFALHSRHQSQFLNSN